MIEVPERTDHPQLALRPAPFCDGAQMQVVPGLRIAVVLAVLAVPASAHVLAETDDTHPARPLPGKADAAYPPEAHRLGIEGTVTFTALVDPSGKVRSVEVRTVPTRGLGFEQSVRTAVMTWRFDPAVQDGEPIPWFYQGEIEFFRKHPYYRARMYRSSAKQVWRELEALIKELKLGVAEIDRDSGALVTRAARFGKSDRRPPGPPLGKGIEGQQFQFYIWVPQFIEPARVYVDSVVRSRARVHYRTVLPETWLFEKLEERLGEPGHLIPETYEHRCKLAGELAGEPTEEMCVGAVSKDGRPRMSGVGDVTNPVRVRAAYYKPVFPGREQSAGKQAKVVMQAVITEDGVVRDVEILQSTSKGDFEISAVQAVLFWRYRPAEVDGRPVEVYFTIRIDYTFG